MIEPTSHPTPNWELIFKVRPDLSPPGYKEAEAALQDQKNRAEFERIRLMMQEINKDKISAKNRNRNRRRS
jgi:hypothetical protein